MTLRDLAAAALELLASGVAPETPVEAEGCDCEGAAGALVVSGRDPALGGGAYVLLRRVESMPPPQRTPPQPPAPAPLPRGTWFTTAAAEAAEAAFLAPPADKEPT